MIMMIQMTKIGGDEHYGRQKVTSGFDIMYLKLMFKSGRENNLNSSWLTVISLYPETK